MTAIVRYGILGYGRWGERVVAPALRTSPNSTCVALQKRSADAARRAAREAGIPLAFEDAAELVAHPEVDAVFIASANGLHCPQTVLAAEAGKHVLVEKPMALSVGEAERMIEACRQNNVRLMVGHMIRFSPHARRMREIVQSGLLGTVVSARADFVYDASISTRSWLLDRVMAGGGPVFDVGVHCLDTLRFVLDDEVVSVKSHLEPQPSAQRTEEVANLSMAFAQGTLASIHCSYRAPVRRRSIEIVGERAMLSSEEFTLGRTTIPLRLTFGERDLPTEVRIEEIDVPDLYVEEITHLSDCILTGREPISSGSNGLANQRVLDQAMLP
jgi:1,5-anhydro-D-fructose reductase (1,5-anhydro-D-mannitol-forming)